MTEIEKTLKIENLRAELNRLISDKNRIDTEISKIELDMGYIQFADKYPIGKRLTYLGMDVEVTGYTPDHVVACRLKKDGVRWDNHRAYVKMMPL